MFVLIAANGPDKGRVFECPDGESWVIGRGSGPRCLLDNTTSRMHAEVTCRDGQWYVHDLQSTNGTYLNGQKIVGETPIQEGDRIQLGCTQLLVSSAHNDATIAGNVALVPTGRPAYPGADPEGEHHYGPLAHARGGSTELTLQHGKHASPAVSPHAGPPQWVQRPPPSAPASIGKWLAVLTAAVIVYFMIDVYKQDQLEIKHYIRSIHDQVQQPKPPHPQLDEKFNAYIDTIDAKHEQHKASLLTEVRDAIHTQQARQEAQQKQLDEIQTALRQPPRLDEQALADKLAAAVQPPTPPVQDPPQNSSAEVLKNSLAQLQLQLQKLLDEVGALKSQQAQPDPLSHSTGSQATSHVPPPTAEAQEPPVLLPETTGQDRQATASPDGLGPHQLRGFNRVVFLVDASGSLIDSMPQVIQEVSRSIEHLEPGQDFSVIFYQNDGVIEVPPTGLKSAADSMKKEVQAWIRPGTGHVLPRGSSNPLDALHRAMDYAPDLLCLYSDTITGSRPDEISHHRLLQELDRINKGRRTKINTVQFFYNDPQQTLKTIAFEHGGTYHFIEEPKPEDFPDVPDLLSDSFHDQLPPEPIQGSERPVDSDPG